MRWAAELTSTRGHEVQDGRYLDGASVEDEPDRPCVWCGLRPSRHVRQGTVEWDDACIDALRVPFPYVVSDACCGHGDVAEAKLRILGDPYDSDLKGDEALEMMRLLGGDPCPAR